MAKGTYDWRNQEFAGVSNYANYAALENKKKEDELKNQADSVINQGGYTVDQDMINNISAMNLGQMLGKRQFSGDADWQRLKKMREEGTQGFSAPELSALRAESRGEQQGQRQAALQRLRSNLAKGGVGGARAAAIQGSQDVQQQRGAADAERKLLLDEAQMKRQGQSDLQDLIMREKMGEAGYTFGTAGLQSANKAAQAARNANSSGKK